MRAFLDQMENRDMYLFGAIIVATLVATYLTDKAVKSAGGEKEAIALTVKLNMGTTLFMALTLLAAVIISYYCIRVYSGDIGKGFYMFIIGFIFQLSLPIEVFWHLENLPKLVGAPWLGIPSYWWFGFFHAAIAVSIGLMGYGFYMLVRDLDLGSAA